MSVCITVAPTGHISMKFDTRDFYGNLSGMSKFDSIWQKYQALYVETYVHFTLWGT